jgi:RNA polymerase sporulation-specific sigma factor
VLGSEPDEIYRDLESDDERTRLYKAVNSLNKREKMIMTMRFGIGGGREFTQKEVADALGISQSYISRLEKRIIDKIKKDI